MSFLGFVTRRAFLQGCSASYQAGLAAGRKEALENNTTAKGFYEHGFTDGRERGMHEGREAERAAINANPALVQAIDADAEEEIRKLAYARGHIVGFDAGMEAAPRHHRERAAGLFKELEEQRSTALTLVEAAYAGGLAERDVELETKIAQAEQEAEELTRKIRLLKRRKKKR